MAAWKLPLIVLAIALPIVAGFYAGGPGVGVAVGALAGVALLVIAARQRPRGAIVPPPAEDGRRHVLIVVTDPVEEPASVWELARSARLRDSDGSDDADVMVLAPARIGFLDRWASDVEVARQRAQRNLVATVAALAKAGIPAEARVGDEDVVQAIEDRLQSFPASEVVLVGAEDGIDEDDVAQLRRRLRARFRRIALSPRER